MKEIDNNKMHSSQKDRNQFEDTNWNPISSRFWVVHDNTCAICRNLITNPCIQCQSNMTDDCPTACGVCQHVYHFHCISRWLRKREVCPLDYCAWKYKN